MSKQHAYPDNKKLIVDEINNVVDKLTDEFGVSPVYTCIHTTAYCMAQISIVYQKNGKPVPKEIQTFLDKTYPKLLKDHESLIEEQHTMLNTSGSA